jgi:putative solute:sodium symporter small subunit
MTVDESARLRWRRSQRITAWLLGVWFVVTFGGVFFARELNLSILGWPFSFWVASQGALIVYVLLVWVYARLMHRLDIAHGLAADD